MTEKIIKRRLQSELVTLKNEAKQALVKHINVGKHCSDIKRSQKYNRIDVTQINTMLYGRIFVELKAELYVNMTDLEWLMKVKCVRPEIIAWYQNPNKALRIHIQIRNTYDATGKSFMDGRKRIEQK